MMLTDDTTVFSPGDAAASSAPSRDSASACVLASSRPAGSAAPTNSTSARSATGAVPVGGDAPAHAPTPLSTATVSAAARRRRRTVVRLAPSRTMSSRLAPGSLPLLAHLPRLCRHACQDCTMTSTVPLEGADLPAREQLANLAARGGRWPWRAGAEASSMRQSAVLILFGVLDDVPAEHRSAAVPASLDVLLTRRSPDLDHHP